MKMKKFTSEVTIGKDEIQDIEFVKIADPTEVAARSQNTPVQVPDTPKPEGQPFVKSPANIISKSPYTKPFKPVQNYSNQNGHDTIKQNHKTTKPIAILRKPTASAPNSFMSSSAPQSVKADSNQNGKNKSKKKHNNKNYDLMQPDDFSEEVCVMFIFIL